ISVSSAGYDMLAERYPDDNDRGRVMGLASCGITLGLLGIVG
ncbi:unnamed protein product, partial [Didymodactylos carnosus]